MVGGEGEERRIRSLLDEQQFIFENAGVGILLLQERRILKCNQCIADLVGAASAAELEGQTTEVLYGSREAYEAVGREAYTQLSQHGVASFETELRHRDGSRVCVLLSGRSLSADAALEAPSIWVYTDITERKAAELALQRLERRFTTAFDSCPLAASISLLEDGRFVEVSSGYERNFGWSKADLLGKTSVEVGFWPDPQARTTWVDAMRRAVRLVGYETVWTHKNGDLRQVSMSSEIVELDGRTCVLAYITDITERKRAEERIHALAYYDQLTGLSNRACLSEQLAQSVRLANRNGQRFALMALDLDNFKSINDLLGHHVGDQLLVCVAERLLASVRQSDVVARFGGDEFVVYLPDIDAPADAAVVAEKILGALATPCLVGGHELNVSASIGICLFPDDSSDSFDLLQKVDAAMYYAKANGRNQYQFFKEEYQLAAVRRHTLEADLRKAVEEGQFVLHYQPQLDLRTGHLVGVESLIRWNHPRHGMISPLDFIPIAEETGIILSIGEWVIEESCRQIAAWRAAGIQSLSVSVNLAASQFLDRHLPARIRALLEKYDVTSDQMILEVTESMSMASPDETIASMSELVACGLSLSIDDFGTGYSSLAYLKMFPLRALKIDRSFVKDIETDGSGAEICDVSVLLAHKLGLEVVAEGVETEAQLKYLLSIGCEKVQGYLISKPLPADQIERFVLDNASPLFSLGTIDLWDGAGSQ